MGHKSMEMLLKIIDGKKVKNIELQPEFVIRESIAKIH